LMCVETWVVPLSIVVTQVEMSSIVYSEPFQVLRMLRLFRLTRLAHLLQHFPDLLTIAKGLKAAIKAVTSSVIIVGVLNYTFSIFIHMMLKDEKLVEDRYGSLPKVMWTLLMDGTFTDDLRASIQPLFELKQYNTIIGAMIILVFVFISAITMLNMLIGVICEVVSAVTDSERDACAIRVLKQTIFTELVRFDTDGNRKISHPELKNVMKDPGVQEVLRGLQVDGNQLAEMLLTLFPDPHSEVSFERVMEIILLCRKHLPLTFAHVSELAFTTRSSIAGFLRNEMELAMKSIRREMIHRFEVAGFVAAASPVPPELATDVRTL